MIFGFKSWTSHLSLGSASMGILNHDSLKRLTHLADALNSQQPLPITQHVGDWRKSVTSYRSFGRSEQVLFVSTRTTTTNSEIVPMFTMVHTSQATVGCNGNTTAHIHFWAAILPHTTITTFAACIRPCCRLTTGELRHGIPVLSTCAHLPGWYTLHLQILHRCSTPCVSLQIQHTWNKNVNNHFEINEYVNE